MNCWMIGSLTVLVVAVGFVAITLVQRPVQAGTGLDGLQMTVHEAPTCDCCGGWIDEMLRQGVEVRQVNTNDTVAVKLEFGVLTTGYSWHTAQIEGYAVEGHVPVEALEDLIASRPDIDGIAIGGMPAGSPWMPGTKVAPFEIVAFDGTSGVTLFGSY